MHHRHRRFGLATTYVALAACLWTSACSDTAQSNGDAIALPLDSAGGDASVGNDSSADTGAADTGIADSGAEDTASVDTTDADSASQDVVADVADTTVADTDVDDTDVDDTAIADTTADDTTVADTIADDTTVADTVADDTTVADTVTDDTAVADTVDPDTAVADTTPDDTTTTDTTTNPTGGPFTPSTCKKVVNTNTDGTVNPFISPARDGEFYISYVAKGGNLMLTWESPTKCLTSVGPIQVNKTAGEVYYWGGIAVVSDAAGNFYAVWESSTKNTEISFAWSKTGKDFSAPIEVVSTTTNGQDPALWVPAPGVVHAAWRGHHPTLPQYDPVYALNPDVFTGKPFSAGTLVFSDADQDDQVSIVTDSKGNIFIAWQSFDGNIFIAKSSNGGANWTPPVQVNDVKDKANAGKANFLAILPNDRLVLTWWDSRKQKSGNENDVFADSSADGLTWGADVQMNDDDARYQEDPSLAVGRSGACSGIVYAVWQDFRSKKSYDIYAARSLDGGLTWSKNEAIASDLAEDEMNPAIAVDSSCNIGVAWRDSTKNQDFDIGSTYLTW
jgi:hypothetical protein